MMKKSRPEFNPAVPSGRFQPFDFCLELEAQLRAFLVGEPVRHLREDCAVKQNGLRLPRQLLRCAGFGQNLVELVGRIEPTPCAVAQRARVEAVIRHSLAMKMAGYADRAALCGRSAPPGLP